MKPFIKDVNLKNEVFNRKNIRIGDYPIHTGYKSTREIFFFLFLTVISIKAIWANNKHAIEFLLKFGAHINQKDGDECTPLLRGT